MELNYVMTIVDRERAQTMETICQNLKLPLTLTMLCQGTATSEHLSLYGLAQKDKALISTVADREQTQKLMRAAKIRMFIDIPGNGIMLSVPIKSVGGGRTMAYLTDHMTPGGGKPKKPRSKTQAKEWLSKGGHTVYNLPGWSLGFTTAIELYGDYENAVGYVCKYIGKDMPANLQDGPEGLPELTAKIGGRWYYSGGELARPDIRLVDLEWREVAQQPGAYVIEVPEAGCVFAKVMERSTS